MGAAAHRHIIDRQPELITVANALLTPCRHLPEYKFTGNVYDSSGKCIELARRPSKVTRYQHVDDVGEACPAEQKLAGRWLYAGHLLEAFGHDLLETSARLWPLLDADLQVSGIVVHLWRETSNALQVRNNVTTARIFELFGVDRSRIAVVDKKPLSVEELIVPEPAYQINSCALPVLRDVFDRMAASVQATGAGSAEKIFLSRQGLDGPARSAHFARIQHIAEKAGFVTLHPQSLSLDAQVAILRQASVVAGPDGSAMHLSVFCKPGTKILSFDARHVENQHIIETLCELDARHFDLRGSEPDVPEFWANVRQTLMDITGDPRIAEQPPAA